MSHHQPSTYKSEDGISHERDRFHRQFDGGRKRGVSFVRAKASLARVTYSYSRVQWKEVFVTMQMLKIIIIQVSAVRTGVSPTQTRVANVRYPYWLGTENTRK